MNDSLITKPLGLFGWDKYEPVILASLATKLPLLLMGKHGLAKSFILERLAEALKLSYRFYNASLINYDDLVGIPIPSNNNTSLDYISNPNSIWDAEVVFIDELNRTKPELQNKMFPIIYDKRIQGINLDKLQYRWAAMNPFYLDEENEDDIYLGAMPLDLALADRFPFLIEVPSWDDLEENERELLLDDQYEGKHEFQVDINKLIKEVEEEIVKQKSVLKEDVKKYIITLMDLLIKSFGYISIRRATMMQETLIAIYASKLVLNRYLGIKNLDFVDVCYLHILCSLPNMANKKIDKLLLINIAKNALKISSLDESIEKRILIMNDPLEKLKFAIKNKDNIDINLLTEIIPSSLSNLDIYTRKAMSLISYLSFRKMPSLSATIMETIASDIRDILKPYKKNELLYITKAKLSNKIISILNSIDDAKEYKKYLNNYLYSFFPNDYSSEDEVEIVSKRFINLYEELMYV